MDGEKPNTPEGQEPSPQAGQEPPSSGGQTPPPSPPWGDDFSPERAWNTIQQLRTAEREYKLEKQSREREKMTELERMQSERDQYKQELETARFEGLRTQIVFSKGLPPTAVKYLTGTTQEELERNADELKRMIGGQGQPSPAPDFGAGARPTGNGDEENFSSIIRRAAGRPV